MKDTNFNGKIICIIILTVGGIILKTNLTTIYMLSYYVLLRLAYLHGYYISDKKNKILTSLQYQRMFYHINNIRAINRIGPHNQEVLSVIIGSILGDSYGHKRSGEGVRIFYRQSIIHKEYLFWLYNFFYNFK